MPQITAPDGSTQVVPGVYTDLRVISSLPGPLPEFQIPVILAGSDRGRPYNFDSVKQSLETAVGPFSLKGTATAVADEFGPNSKIHKAMQFAQNHGLPFAYCVSLSALTRASVIVTSAGAIQEFTLYARSFGAADSHTKVKLAGSDIEFTPILNYSPLTRAAAATATRLYVRSHDWVQVGQTITLGRSDATLNEDHVVARKGEELTTDGRVDPFIELTVGLTAGVLLTVFPMILDYDSNNPEILPAVAGDPLIDQINDNSKIFIAVKHANFSGAAALAVATATALKDIAVWSTTTPGTSPNATAADVDAFITQMNGGDWEQFAITNQLLPQAYLLAMPESAAHISARNYAIAERNRGFPISFTFGTEWGDTVLTAVDDTNPKVRSGVLNSEDCTLCAGGMDQQPAYLSLAGAVFGLKVGGGIGHNLTQDELIYETLEVRWDEINNLELRQLHSAGVLTYRLGTFGAFRFLVSQGLTTLQNNTGLIWNEVTKQTWSIQQRDLADFVDRVIKEDLHQSQLGADGVTALSIGAVLVRRAQTSLERRGFIVPGSHKIISITVNSGGSGFDVVQAYRLPTLVDYITVVSNILIGE